MTIIELSERLGIHTLGELQKFAKENMRGCDDIYVCLKKCYKRKLVREIIEKCK